MLFQTQTRMKIFSKHVGSMWPLKTKLFTHEIKH